MPNALRTLPRIRRIHGVGLDLEEWLISLETEGGLPIHLLFPHDELLVLLQYLSKASRARGWTSSDSARPRRFNVPRQPPIRIMKMSGVYLGTDDDGAVVQFDAGSDEIMEYFLPKSQVMRLLDLLHFQLRRREWAISEERCHHYFARDRCRRPRATGRPFCDQHAKQFEKRSNQSLLESAADAFDRMICENAEGKVTFSGDFDAAEDFTNHLSEFASRGYEQDEMTKAIGLFMKERDASRAPKDPKWRRFEKLAFGIYLLRAEGAEVTFDEQIVGRRTGRSRQVDVCIRFRKQFSSYFAAVECKDERVSIGEVEELKTKREDIGADRIIVLSSGGFQQGAIEAARAYGIDAHELTRRLLALSRLIIQCRCPFMD